ncbi:hypothetical protein AK812_SmicGene12626 [Symbiodinium microadriaticum]|uniref:Uncharacterized protein n=1 Tax=Symbiodinium microadriaticum TaxID=2951 RepID=A0A1Q9EA69_SYMMI|nr:hypothetical protein AK812_SmicGene12626 [Symbiodinium microadriaticum]
MESCIREFAFAILYLAEFEQQMAPSSMLADSIVMFLREARSWAERNTNLPASEMLRGLGPEDTKDKFRKAEMLPVGIFPSTGLGAAAGRRGQTLSFSVASAETTRDLKQRDDCATIELMDDLPVGSYCDGTELQLILQAFHCREICLAAVDGAGKYGAMLQLLEFGGDLACCYIGALRFQDTSLRDLALQLLLKGLPAAEATRLLARALTSGDEELQRKAAMAIARWFYSDRASLSLSLQEVSQNEASLIQSLLEHLERRSKLPSKGRPWEGGPAIFVNDALTAARVTLGGYLTTARRLKPGWMYRQLIPMSGLESLESTKLPQVAAERGVSLEMLKSCLEFNWVNKSGNFLCAAVPEPMFLTVSITNVSHFLRTNPDSGIAEKEDADLWPPSGISLADHGLASYRLTAAKKASDLRGVHALMDTWWGTDAHVQRSVRLRLCFVETFIETAVQIRGRLLLSAELRTRPDDDAAESYDDGGCDDVHRIGGSATDGDRDDEEKTTSTRQSRSFRSGNSSRPPSAAMSEELEDNEDEVWEEDATSDNEQGEGGLAVFSEGDVEPDSNEVEVSLANLGLEKYAAVDDSAFDDFELPETIATDVFFLIVRSFYEEEAKLKTMPG